MATAIFRLIVIALLLVGSDAGHADEAALRAGREAQEAGNHELAIVHLSKAIASGLLPKDMLFYAHRLRSVSYAALKRPEQALADIRKMIDIDPRDIAGHLALADHYFGRDIRAAQKSYETVVALAPRNGYAHARLAYVAISQQRWGDALELSDRAIDLQFGRYWVWYNRGVALQRLRRLDEAIASYRMVAALSSDPDLARRRLEQLDAQ